jgi:hypothetical protein
MALPTEVLYLQHFLPIGFLYRGVHFDNMAAPSATLPVLKSLDEFLKRSYDYIVVGGGNAGPSSAWV